MSRINDFLSEAGIFYMATCDGDRPRVRPLGAHIDMDGKVVFSVGDFKKVYRELLANPNVEIVATKADGHWLRYTGRVVFETEDKYSKALLERNPKLKDIYNEKTGHRMMCFHLEDATALDIPVMGEGESLL